MFTLNRMKRSTRTNLAVGGIFRGGLIFAGILMAIQTGIYFFVQDEGSLALSNDLSAVFSSLAATLGMVYGAVSSNRFDRKLGRAWRLFALALGAWTIGDVIWAVYDIGLGEVP